MTWQPWQVMWSLAFAIFCGCKWFTWRTVADKPSRLRALGYLVAWPGLDASTFLRSRPPAERPSVEEWAFAWGKFSIGMIILYGLARLPPTDRPYLVGWIGMVGIVMVLHFGIFHLLSCWWRRRGVVARPLMDWPLTATSLAEFWGRRWNTAFRDLTHRYLFRPMVPRLGARGALLTGFVFSGLVHDLVISLPARGGYGGPTLFFLSQAAGMMTERSRLGRRAGLGSGSRGWLFTACVLVAPASILFHRPFVVGVVVPFLRTVGAIR